MGVGSARIVEVEKPRGREDAGRLSSVCWKEENSGSTTLYGGGGSGEVPILGVVEGEVDEDEDACGDIAGDFLEALTSFRALSMLRSLSGR